MNVTVNLNTGRYLIFKASSCLVSYCSFELIDLFYGFMLESLK